MYMNGEESDNQLRERHTIPVPFVPHRFIFGFLSVFVPTTRLKSRVELSSLHRRGVGKWLGQSLLQKRKKSYDGDS